MKKERVDVLAFNQGLFETREKAKRSVMAGLVYNDKNERLDKPGEKISVETPLHTKGQVMPYVSRGGLKLEKALNVLSRELRTPPEPRIVSFFCQFCDSRREMTVDCPQSSKKESSRFFRRAFSICVKLVPPWPLTSAA